MMAPNLHTQHDPEMREPKNDQLNGFDPIAVFGFSITEAIPDESTIRARYHKLVRLIGVIYRDDNRLPYTLADANRARENLLSSYRRTVEVTRDYHKPKWNPAADERDLVALLTPIAAGAKAATASTSSQPNIHIPVRGESPAGPSTGRAETLATNSHQGHHETGQESSSDEDIRIVSSRSSVSTRKDPISEITKQEMRERTEKEDEARLALKGARVNPGKGKGKDTTNGQAQSKENPEGADDDEVIYLGTGNEIPGYVLVGHDRRGGGGGRLMVMCVSCRNHANFYALQPTRARQIGGFRLERASYDDVDQSPAMLTVLRNIGEIAPAHMRASRQEMKAYYEVIIAQREADARKP